MSDVYTTCHRCGGIGTTIPPVCATLYKDHGVWWCKDGRECSLRIRRKRSHREANLTSWTDK